MIPMVDLNQQYQQLKSEIDQALQTVLHSCQFILGPNVQAFEEETNHYLNCQHAVACASGTDALHLALLAAGIGPGDEVITSAFTFIATAEAICYVGATPVFVDIDERTFNLKPELIESAISNKTKAIIPVHLFGQPADMQAISTLAKQYKLSIIEDCAQSFGADIKNMMTGTLGDFGCYSFFPSKNLGCYGDGGLVSTQSEAAANKLKMLRNHGSSQQYHHDIIGYNSRLDEMQAAILRVKLKYIDQYNTQRRRVAHYYNQLLQDTSVVTPHEDNTGTHVYHQYTTLMPNRDKIMQHLRKHNIACAIYYPVPLHQQTVFKSRQQTLPVTEKVAQQCLSLPIFPEMSNAQIETVTDHIKQAL